MLISMRLWVLILYYFLQQMNGKKLMTKEQALENIRWALVNYLDDNPSEDEELIDKSFNKIREDIDNED